MPNTVAKLTWEGGMKFSAIGSFGHKIVLDTGEKSGGEMSGFQPTEMLLWALAGCTGMDVVHILKKQRQNLTSMEIQITGQRMEEHPRYYHTIDMKFVARGEELDPKKLQDAIFLSHSKYCTIAQTLKHSPTINTSFDILHG